MRKILIFFATLSFLLFASYHVYAYAWHLHFMPEGLGIWRVLYAEEESWGFGPGANEVGLIIYALPEKAAEEIEKEKTVFLYELSSYVKGDDWRRHYERWNPTPIPADEEWANVGRSDPYPEPTKEPHITTYLGGYGDYLPLTPDIVKQIDEIIATPGSFYAYGRTGVVIVSPARRLAIFAYRG